jgi:hypothetical protein
MFAIFVELNLEGSYGISRATEKLSKRLCCHDSMFYGRCVIRETLKVGVYVAIVIFVCGRTSGYKFQEK